MQVLTRRRLSLGVRFLGRPRRGLEERVPKVLCLDMIRETVEQCRHTVEAMSLTDRELDSES